MYLWNSCSTERVENCFGRLQRDFKTQLPTAKLTVEAKDEKFGGFC